MSTFSLKRKFRALFIIVTIAQDMARLFASYRRPQGRGEPKDRIEELERSWAAHVRASGPLVAAARSFDAQGAMTAFREDRPRFLTLSKAISQLASDESRAAERQTQAAARTYRNVRNLMAGLALAIVCASAGAAVYVERSVTDVLSRMAALMGRLAGGGGARLRSARAAWRSPPAKMVADPA